MLINASIVHARHPSFNSSSMDWEKWRRTWRGGQEFRDYYLTRFTSRETLQDFNERRDMTPIPRFAGAAIDDIRNSIFQRMSDIVRRDGSESYQKAIEGLDGGVDNRGSSMNSFLGNKVLEELLVMGRVGIYVDMPVVDTNLDRPSLADAEGKRPYLYAYAVEDICSWSTTKPEEPSEYQSILLRDTYTSYDQQTLLPLNQQQRYRLVWIDKATGLVNLQFLSPSGEMIDKDGMPATEPYVLELTRIPFVMIDISDSLIKHVCEHQIALLNLGSSDVNYALKANFPFYVEQRDRRGVGDHLKRVANEDGTATAGGQGASDEAAKVGVTQGRYYDLNAEAPSFIHPSPEPLEASLKLQAKLENDIRKLVNLAVLNIASRASAESKQMDNQGLESGLSFIGLQLEAAERRIADFWAAYEERIETRRQIPTIKYPDRYSLKTDMDRIEEADKLSDLMFAVPGRTIKKEISKTIVTTLLAGKVKVDIIDKIHREIDAAKFTTSDPETIIAAKEAGLVGEQTASVALGFEDDEYKQAREDHTDRAIRVAEAQAKATAMTGGGDPAARGVDDLSADPAGAGKDEKAASRNTDLKDTTKAPVRGEGK